MQDILPIANKRDFCYTREVMIKTIDFAGIELDNYTVREMIMIVEKKMSDHGFHTIEEVNMDTLMMAESDPVLKEALHMAEHTVISENGILEAVGSESYQRRHEIEHHDFFFEMMKRIERNRQAVFVIGDVRERVDRFCEFLKDRFEKCDLTGAEALEDCQGTTDAMVNEINALAPDVILSVLPCPDQEHFLVENHEKLSAGLWYGIGSWDFTKQKLGFFGRLRKKMRAHRLERQLDHYQGTDVV